MPSYVIVGASRGLGYEWLRQLSTDPENTIIGLVRTPASVEAKLSSDKIANVHILQADMADHVALNNAAQEVSKITKGSLDYLIVNGVYSDGDHNRLTPTAFTGHEEVLRREMIRSLDVNVVGVIYSINAFLQLVRKSTIKKVVALTTGLADTDNAPKSGVPNYVVYTSMKAALNMVIARYSVELREDGIVFLALSPGVVLTSEKPPTAEDMADFQRLKQAVLKIKPEWQGPMTPSESVQLQKQVIEKATIDESGSFLSHFGNKEWI